MHARAIHLSSHPRKRIPMQSGQNILPPDIETSSYQHLSRHESTHPDQSKREVVGPVKEGGCPRHLEREGDSGKGFLSQIVLHLFYALRRYFASSTVQYLMRPQTNQLHFGLSESKFSFLLFCHFDFVQLILIVW